MGLNKKIKTLLENRPKYKIQDEAFETQALAKNQAFGRDRGIQQAEQNIMTQGADAMGQAQQVSGSTNALLDTLANVTNSQNQNLRELGVNEAQIQSDRMKDLYGANNAMIDEQDKAWNFNVNEPYQNQIQALRDRKKFRQELLGKALDTVGGIAGAGAMAGGIGNLFKWK
jgi:hypothetical protein